MVSPISKQEFSPMDCPQGSPIFLNSKEKRVNEIILERIKNLDIIAVIDGLLKKAKSHKNKFVKENIYREIYKELYPYANTHIHLEGVPFAIEYVNWAIEYNLYWDPQKQQFRRREYSRKYGYERIAAKIMTPGQFEPIVKLMRVLVTDKSVINKSQLFDQSFTTRGSAGDRTPFKVQIESFRQKMKESNTIYAELMFGIYDIVVPEKFQNLCEQLYPNVNEKNVQILINVLSQPLNDVCTPSELEKIKRKIEGRFGESAETKAYYEILIKQSYVKAFGNLMDKCLEDIDSDFFKAENNHTMKLIFEVMRHYSLGKFFAWLYAALAYIENDNSKVAGINVDGPQKNANSLKFFNAQMEFIKLLKTRFPKAGISIHAQEFSEKDIDATTKQRELSDGLKKSKSELVETPKSNLINNNRTLSSKKRKSLSKDEKKENQGNSNETKPKVTYVPKNELSTVVEICDRLGHGTLTFKIPGYESSLAMMQERGIPVEICPSSVQVTTAVDLKDIPFIEFLIRAILIILGTDDPGIVETNMYLELVKLLETFDMDHEDVKSLTRTAIDKGFWNKTDKSLYKTEKIKRKSSSGEITKIRYVLIEPFNSFDWSKPDEVNEKLKNMPLTEKEKKEIQLELAFSKHEEKIRKNVPHYAEWLDGFCRDIDLKGEPMWWVLQPEETKQEIARKNEAYSKRLKNS